MNPNVFTSSNVFISSLGLTPYYNMVFLIVKRGRVDVSIINGSQGSLTLYEHEPFSWSSKKSLTERIHNIYITPVMYSFQVFHPKQIMLHICYGHRYWLNTQYVVWGLYEWFAWDRQYLTGTWSSQYFTGNKLFYILYSFM